MTPLVIAVLAHVKWFTDPRLHPTEYGLLLSAPVIAAFVLAAGAAGVAYVIQRRVPEPRAIRSLERYAATGPLALRIALGVALIAAAAANWLFVPSLVLDRDAVGVALRAIEAACGLFLLAGLWANREQPGFARAVSVAQEFVLLPGSLRGRRRAQSMGPAPAAPSTAEPG